VTQNPDPKTFYLSLPCYNEGARLADFLPSLCKAILKSGLSVEVQIVDDGSEFYHQGHYRSLLKLLRPAFSFLRDTLTLDFNQGKGRTVYAGWDQAKSADMLVFADADGAVGPEEVVRVLKMVNENPETANTLYVASRIENETTEVNRRAIRNIGGLTFRWLRKQLFSLPIQDTQCGFKVVPNAFFTENREKLIESGFAFDIELLYRAQQANINLKEVPVTWNDIKGGHMSFRNSISLFKDLLRLKYRLDKEE